MDVKIDGSVLEKISSFKMLGMTFCSKLDWGSIAKTALKKIEALIFLMKFLSLEVALYLYIPYGCCHVCSGTPLPHSQGRSTRYSDRLHDFSVTIPRYYKDAYVNSFFPYTSWFWNSLHMKYFYDNYHVTYEFQSESTLYSSITQLNHLVKWSSVRLRTKSLWVRITLLSLKLQIWRLLRARSSLTFKQNYRVWIQSETGTWTKQPPEVFCLKCYKIHRDFNFTKKETLAQVFSCEFCKNFKNTFSYRTLPVAASDVT